jgi:hypothetical protein
MAESGNVTGEDCRPLLANFAEPRVGDPTIPGHYCPEQQLWVIETGAGPVPIIQAGSPLLEVTTKTRVIQETDDTAPSPLLETVTKTAAQIESDDDRPRLTSLLDPASLAVQSH